MNMSYSESPADRHAVVTHDEWLAARRQLLARERELTHLRDRIARDRRALPWERVDKAYLFDTPAGPRSLSALFGPHRQLIVQHFMFAPDWEQGCPSCSYMADHTDGMTVHLAQRDIAFVAISRAPLAMIERFRQRMGWQFNWVSSGDTDFNYDYGVSFRPEQQATGKVHYNYCDQYFPDEEAPGISVFYKNDEGDIFHTYSTYHRGVEVMMGAYGLMDLTPLGRNEREVPNKMEWVRHHDRYAGGTGTPSCCHTPA
ncbi:MAG TPA: thioredoxin family protein [Advenella sp.]|nr:thioredoxin family protein [Advenella sp.]